MLGLKYLAKSQTHPVIMFTRAPDERYFLQQFVISLLYISLAYIAFWKHCACTCFDSRQCVKQNFVPSRLIQCRQLSNHIGGSMMHLFLIVMACAFECTNVCGMH